MRNLLQIDLTRQSSEFFLNAMTELWQVSIREVTERLETQGTIKLFAIRSGGS